MQDRLEPALAPRRRRRRPRACAVRSSAAAGIDEVGAEGLADRLDRGAAGKGQAGGRSASVSISSAPRSTSRAATVLLPLPMPPVRPTRRSSGTFGRPLRQAPSGGRAGSCGRQPEAHQQLAEEHGDEPAAGEIGSEGNRHLRGRGCERRSGRCPTTAPTADEQDDQAESSASPSRRRGRRAA